MFASPLLPAPSIRLDSEQLHVPVPHAEGFAQTFPKSQNRVPLNVGSCLNREKETAYALAALWCCAVSVLVLRRKNHASSPRLATGFEELHIVGYVIPIQEGTTCAYQTQNSSGAKRSPSTDIGE